MDTQEIINNYLTKVRISLENLNQDELNEIRISEVVNIVYHNMRAGFDKEILPKLNEDEIEKFFDTIDSKTNELIDSFNSK